jgi:hypothetical protein
VKQLHTRAFALAALLLSAACADITSAPPAVDATVDGAASNQKLLGTVTCRVDVAAQATRCGAPVPAGGGAEARVLLNSFFYVQTSASFTNNGVATFFNKIYNDLGQDIGTQNGITADTIFAFITNISVTGGSGTVTPNNHDGTRTFTASNQPYWRWVEIVAPYTATPSTSTWTFNVPNTVTSWTYTVGLSAPIAHPDGWVEISGNTQIQHGQYQLLTATVKDWTGELDTTDQVTWTGTNVSGQIYVSPYDDRTGHVLGVRTGTAEVTASFGTATPKTIGVNVY